MSDDLAPDAPDRLIDTNQAAEMLGISPVTLRKSRIYRTPNSIRYVKLGSRVRYSTREIARHIRLNTLSNTAERPRG